MMKSKCYCGKMIESKHSEKEKLHFLWCPDCKIGGKAATVESAIKIFKSEVEKRAAQMPLQQPRRIQSPRPQIPISSLSLKPARTW
jgi:hypothetical protein